MSSKNKKKSAKNAKKKERKIVREIRSATRTVSGRKPRSARWKAELSGLETPFGSLGGLKINTNDKKTRALGGMVGLGYKASNPQVNSPPTLSRIMKGGVEYQVCVGSDLITTVQTADGGQNPGDLLVTQVISPSALPNSRLAQFAPLFQRYRFEDIRFRYVPIANSTQSGQLMGYADFDPDNDLEANNPLNVKLAAAHQGEDICQIWDEKWWDMRQAGTFTDLYTQVGDTVSSDTRFEDQGTFYLMAASVLGGQLPLGNLYVHYKVLFSIPFLAPEQSVTGAFAAVNKSSATLDGSNDIVFNTVTVPAGIYTNPIVFSGDTATIPTVSAGAVLYVTMNLYGTSNQATSDWSTTLTVANLGTAATTVATNNNGLGVVGSKNLASAFSTITVTTSGSLVLTWTLGSAPTSTTFFCDMMWLLQPAPVLSVRERRRRMRDMINSDVQTEVGQLQSQVELLTEQLKRLAPPPGVDGKPLPLPDSVKADALRARENYKMHLALRQEAARLYGDDINAKLPALDPGGYISDSGSDEEEERQLGVGLRKYEESKILRGFDMRGNPDFDAHCQMNATKYDRINVKKPPRFEYVDLKTGMPAKKTYLDLDGKPDASPVSYPDRLRPVSSDPSPLVDTQSCDVPVGVPDWDSSKDPGSVPTTVYMFHGMSVTDSEWVELNTLEDDIKLLQRRYEDIRSGKVHVCKEAFDIISETMRHKQCRLSERRAQIAEASRIIDDTLLIASRPSSITRSTSDKSMPKQEPL